MWKNSRVSHDQSKEIKQKKILDFKLKLWHRLSSKTLSKSVFLFLTILFKYNRHITGTVTHI